MKLSRRSSSHEFKGFLDQGTTLTGELHFSGALRIDGTVHGSITTSDLLIVGEKASIHADIRAGEVQVHGAVLGNIEASGRVEIFPRGILRGDVRTPQLVIAEGGRFEGGSHPTEVTEAEVPLTEYNTSQASQPE
jgi:cytoskeletal protein CcmA (bactofilin family)